MPWPWSPVVKGPGEDMKKPSLDLKKPSVSAVDEVKRAAGFGPLGAQIKIAKYVMPC